jgi:NAD(P)-dependent dehydrogenase (short-subunit alcohol dehydrogenase family)
VAFVFSVTDERSLTLKVMGRPTDKVAVIARGTSGNGLATARVFAAEGAGPTIFARDKGALAHARAVLFLAREKSSSVNGAELQVHGDRR